MNTIKEWISGLFSNKETKEKLKVLSQEEIKKEINKIEKEFIGKEFEKKKSVVVKNIIKPDYCTKPFNSGMNRYGIQRIQVWVTTTFPYRWREKIIKHSK